MHVITGELADFAERAATDAQRVLRNARRALRTATGHQAGQLRRATHELAGTLQRTGTIVAQTRSPAGRVMPDSATRVVSLHDGDARPIRRGRLGNPVEFGYKAQVIDNADGIVVDYTVEQGNPPNARQLAPAIERITARSGTPPQAATADCGYGEARVETDLRDLGVRQVVIPRKGKPGPVRREFEHSRPFRRLVKST